jgi:hypothetical protein
MLLIVTCHSFAALVATWILWALATACVSGADAAFLYDAAEEASGELSVQGTPVEGAFRRAWSVSDALHLVAMGVGSGLAGFLYARAPDLPFAVDAGLGLAAALTILGAGRGKRRGSAQPRPGPRASTWHALRGALAHAPMRRYLLFTALSIMVMGGLSVFIPPIFSEMGLSPRRIGLLYAASQVSGALGAAGGSLWGGRVELADLPRRYLPWLWLFHLPLAMGGVLPAAAGLLLASAWFYFFEARWGELLGSLAGAEHRATHFSLSALLNGLASAGASIGAGFLADSHGVKAAAAFVLALSAGSFVVLLALERRCAA